MLGHGLGISKIKFVGISSPGPKADNGRMVGATLVHPTRLDARVDGRGIMTGASEVLLLAMHYELSA